MKPLGLALLAGYVACALVARAADATTPVDYAQRSDPFAPGSNAAATPEKKTPATNTSVQDKRVEKNVIERQTAPLGDRRAGIDVKEAREKSVREQDSDRPAATEQPTSGFNHRKAGISTSGDASKPPMVAKYQDSLTAASATNMARFPAMDGATSAKINRFVFRKNPPENGVLSDSKSVTPAAGGSVLDRK